MPATYEDAPDEVLDMAADLLKQFETHHPLTSARVSIQYQMAFAEKDDDGNIKGCAVKWHGRKALGLCKIINLQDRASGMKDARIVLDGDEWADMNELERRALLDHELHHLQVCMSRANAVKHDAHGRPVLKLRKHDVEIGHFVVIAQRHGLHSQECIQMRRIWDSHGQAFWPDLCGVNVATGMSRFKNIIKESGATVSIHSSGKEIFSTAKAA